MPISFKKNDYIFEEGEELNQIYYVLEGAVSLLYRFEFEKTSYEILFSQIKNNTFFAVENFFEDNFSDYAVKATEDSNINPISIANRAELEKMIKEKPNYGVPILRSLLKIAAQTATSIVSLEKLYANLCKLEAIGLGTIGFLGEKNGISVIDKEYMENCAGIYQAFTNQNIELLPLSQKVFSAAFDDIVAEEMTFFTEADKKEITFFSKLYALPGEFQTQLYSKEPFFIGYYVEKTSIHLNSLIKTIRLALEKILKKYHIFFSPQGLLDNLINIKYQLANNAEIQKSISTVVTTIISNVLKLSSFIQTNAPSYFSALEKKALTFKEKNSAVIQQTKTKETEEDKIEEEQNYTIPEELKNSVEKILHFAEIEEEFYKQFKDKFSKFKAIKEKLSGDDQIRRLRNSVTTDYWRIYEKCFIKSYNSQQMIKPVELMLRYGFFDETLIHPKTIHFILNRKPEPIEDDLPIYDAYEWMERIISRKSDPSINAMGETYDKFLREEATRRSKKEVVLPEDIDKDEMRVEFEIKNLVTECSKICSGEIFNYSPILLDEAFSGDASKYFVSKSKIREEFFKIRSIDYSAFYREVMFRNPDEGYEELVYKEVLPNIILLPSWGKKSMCWQVKERTKDTRGRLLFPSFIMENLQELMIEVFGIFRWELLKETLGPAWNDITQMTLTAEYMDYIQFYKKNKDLTMETKEKIALEFKKFRSDRDKFVNDYVKWIEMESEGRPALNKVVRNIFYRQIPFRKEIRDKLKDFPAYAEIHNKFINLRKKDLVKYQNKFAKYTKNGKPLHPVLEEHLNFFKQ